MHLLTRISKTLANERFRSAGFLSRPDTSRTAWEYTQPPKSPFRAVDPVLETLKRRGLGEAHTGNRSRDPSLKNWIHVILR